MYEMREGFWVVWFYLFWWLVCFFVLFPLVFEVVACKMKRYERQRDKKVRKIYMCVYVLHQDASGRVGYFDQEREWTKKASVS